MSFCFLGRPAHVHYPINMYEHLYSAFKLVEKSDTKKKKKKNCSAFGFWLVVVVNVL